jgi:hypothetical protein
MGEERGHARRDGIVVRYLVEAVSSAWHNPLGGVLPSFCMGKTALGYGQGGNCMACVTARSRSRKRGKGGV